MAAPCGIWRLPRGGDARDRVRGGANAEGVASGSIGRPSGAPLGWPLVGCIARGPRSVDARWRGRIRLTSSPFDAVPRPLPGQTQPMVDGALSPRGTFLAAFAADGEVLVWDVETRQLSRRFTFPQPTVELLAFSSDEQLLAAGGAADTVVLWEVRTGRVKMTLPTQLRGSARIAFSPAGALIATANDVAPDIELWQLSTGQRRCAARFGKCRGARIQPRWQTPRVGRQWSGDCALGRGHPERAWAAEGSRGRCPARGILARRPYAGLHWR